MNITRKNLELMGFEYQNVNGDNYLSYDLRDLESHSQIRIYEFDFESGEVYLYDYSDFIKLPKTFTFIDQIQTLIESIS